MPTGYSKTTGQNPFKGKKRPPFSEEHRRKMSLSMKGRVSPNKGRTGYSTSKKGKKYPHLGGTNHHAWLGSDVGYSALHSWIKRCLGNAKIHSCEHCGSSKNLQWSNIDHEYRRNFDDWQVLCAKCHSKYDREVLHIKTRWNKS